MLRILHACGVACLITVSAGAQPKPVWRDPPSIRYDQISREVLPDIVLVRVPVTVRIWDQGRDVGTVGLRRGVRLRVVAIDRHGILEVEFAGARCHVDHAATDFIERLR